MIRQLDIGHPKLFFLNGLATKNKVQMAFGIPAWIGGTSTAIHIAQARCSKEEIYLLLAPQRIEVPSNYVGLRGVLDQLVQGRQLLVPYSESERKMDEKNDDVLQLQLHHEPFESLVKIVEASVTD